MRTQIILQWVVIITLAILHAITASNANSCVESRQRIWEGMVKNADSIEKLAKASITHSEAIRELAELYRRN